MRFELTTSTLARLGFKNAGYFLQKNQSLTRAYVFDCAIDVRELSPKSAYVWQLWQQNCQRAWQHKSTSYLHRLVGLIISIEVILFGH